VNAAELDGRIGEGWGGVKPNGSHVNVVLAARGGPTFAAAVGMFAHPSPGHTPVLVCIGPDEARYEPIWPPTLMMNKATARDERHETVTWGAAQLGIGQGVLDAVADGLLEASDDRVANRAAVRKAIGTCVEGRDPDAAQRLVAERDSLRNPFYGGE